MFTLHLRGTEEPNSPGIQRNEKKKQLIQTRVSNNL